MCEYVGFIQMAIRQLATSKNSFDMLDVRNKTRLLAGPAIDVRFLACKFETLGFFERGGIPGFILTTKVIEVESPHLLISAQGNFSMDISGALISETFKRTVFNFVKTAAAVKDAIAKAVAQHNLN